jgi:glyoxylase-like metal-dependent hydrolase (beta-lactamase superfamily II)
MIIHSARPFVISTTRARSAIVRAGSVVVSLLVPVMLAPMLLGAQSPTAIIQRAVTAIGGEQAVRGVTNQVTEINSALFQLGQEETPRSPARATISFARITYDFARPRYAIQQENRPFAGSPTRQRRVMTNDVGLFVNNAAEAPDTRAGVAASLRAMRLSPLQVLRTALDAPNTLRAAVAKRYRGELMDGVHIAGRDTAALYFDRGSGLLTVVETLTDDPILGDRRTTTWYTRWQDAGPVKLPRQVDIEVNGRLSQHQVITAATVNGALADSMFAIADSIRTRFAGAPATATAIPVTLNELAPGIWRAEGGTHFSLVVEQPNRLVVVEAPLNAQRSRAVLDTLRARFPSKRVGVAVSTHHHWDHAGGVREYMASGIPITTHRRNVEYVREIGAAPKTIARDAISRGRSAPAVTGVVDSLTVGTGDSRVVLYRLPSTHAEGILAAYVPGARILFVADVLSPAANLPPLGSREVAAMVAAYGITVDRVVGAHGGISPWADVAAAARQ